MTTADPPIRQEKEPASEVVTEVAPGVLRLQLPVQIPGLGHVNCYALEDSRGITIVDPGMPGPQSADSLDERLAAAGFEPRHVHTVVVTHSHIDHFGGTTRFARDGARVVTHESFQNWFDLGGEQELDEVDGADDREIEDDPSELVNRIVEFAPVTPWSNEPWEIPLIDPERVRAILDYDRDFFTIPSPTTRLADADVIELGGREWVAVSTPGHTPDHLCLFDPANGTLLSGDHVLPTITPHLAGMGAGEDPLTEYFDSLERMHHLGDVTVALPAHGHPFANLSERADAIKVHHLERLDALRELLDTHGPESVAELSHQLFKPASWGGMAESETYAHLEHLRLAGDARRDDDAGVLRYQPA